MPPSPPHRSRQTSTSNIMAAKPLNETCPTLLRRAQTPFESLTLCRCFLPVATNIPNILTRRTQHFTRSTIRHHTCPSTHFDSKRAIHHHTSLTLSMLNQPHRGMPTSREQPQSPVPKRLGIHRRTVPAYSRRPVPRSDPNSPIRNRS